MEFPKELAAQMVEESHKPQEIKNGMATAFQTQFRDSKSLNDVASDAMKSFTDHISPALKRMKQSYF